MGFEITSYPPDETSEDFVIQALPADIETCHKKAISSALESFKISSIVKRKIYSAVCSFFERMGREPFSNPEGCVIRFSPLGDVTATYDLWQTDYLRMYEYFIWDTNTSRAQPFREQSDIAILKFFIRQKHLSLPESNKALKAFRLVDQHHIPSGDNPYKFHLTKERCLRIEWENFPMNARIGDLTKRYFASTTFYLKPSVKKKKRVVKFKLPKKKCTASPPVNRISSEDFAKHSNSLCCFIIEWIKWLFAAILCCGCQSPTPVR